MSATVTNLAAHRPRSLTAKERMECLLLALMNEEKAGFCTKEQAGLRTFLNMNAALLRKVAEK